MDEYIKFISAALLNVALVMVVYFLQRKTRFGKFKRIHKELIIGALFGASAIYASCFGVKIWGATMNVRDASPISAGFIFGPIAGIVSGIIGLSDGLDHCLLYNVMNLRPSFFRHSIHQI